ncbi:hypothetical protein QBC32DRAFT_360655 [Pseudoneurospora amorphoporcata]|uniref:Uncharacterized protein n=1 Tax=Pseudoneurospora amorphoporcata TaxID=241081 RepID=A0AAN6SHX0_9PEZI|nr:hypothetical protein QBC32DRAFT_360655 [Pseudoneurospora amorphoporcata]
MSPPQPSRSMAEWATIVQDARKHVPPSDELQLSPSKARWAAVLKKARNELELRSGELYANGKRNLWSFGMKKKGKPQRKGKKKWKTFKIEFSLAKFDSDSDIVDSKFDKPVTWHSRETMKQRTERKHPKPPVYSFDPLPKDFHIYQNPTTLSNERKRRIICGHRFHEKHELEGIPEGRELFWTEPRRSRVESIKVQKEKRQGPAAVVPAPFPMKPGGSSWSQVAVKSFNKVLAKPLPITVPKRAAETPTASVTLKKTKTTTSTTLDVPTASEDVPPAVPTKKPKPVALKLKNKSMVASKSSRST